MLNGADQIIISGEITPVNEGIFAGFSKPLTLLKGIVLPAPQYLLFPINYQKGAVELTDSQIMTTAFPTHNAACPVGDMVNNTSVGQVPFYLYGIGPLGRMKAQGLKILKGNLFLLAEGCLKTSRPKPGEENKGPCFKCKEGGPFCLLHHLPETLDRLALMQTLIKGNNVSFNETSFRIADPTDSTIF